MKFSATLLAKAMLLAAVAASTGCLPSVHSRLDEEKEPHFLEGKSRYAALDYKGAIESYEKAIEVNPQSAAAHLEVGLLYEQNEQDFAAAIYHFQRFLVLRPKSDFEDRVKQQILACKQELAKAVSLPPISQRLQNDYEKLNVKNKQLTDELAAAQALIARLERLTNQPARPSPVARSVAGPAIAIVPSSQVVGMRIASATQGQTHIVKAGETPSLIAKKYGVRVDALMAANPRLDARRMQVGQSLNIPSS